MNLLGKIFVVLIFVMSMLFMAFSVCVYATHRNWKEEVTKKDSDIRSLRTENDQLKEERERAMNILAHERAARTSALTSLNARVVEGDQEVTRMRQQVDQLQEQHRREFAAVTSSQGLLKTLKDDNTKLQNQISQTRASLDEKLKEAIRLTDLNHQLQGEIDRLQRRNAVALQRLGSAEQQLQRFGAKLDDPLTDIPPVLDGTVEDISRDRRTVQVSLGRDDGLRTSHELNFYRRDQYLGRGVVAKVEPEFAIVRLKTLQGRDIRRGDSVATRVE